MTDKNDPNKKIKETDSTTDSESLELKEEAFDVSQDDEEIIDLLDAVEEPASEEQTEAAIAQETDSTTDPESLELKEEAFDVSQDDEEIIDLLDAVEEPASEEQKEAAIAQETDSTTDPEIVELEEEDLNDLKKDVLEEPIELDDEFGEEIAFDQGMEDDFVDSLGMELDAKEDVSEDSLDTEEVSDAQMEAALERVIKKMFYEKIDGILVEVIEKTVNRELERLKSILLEDAAGKEK